MANHSIMLKNSKEYFKRDLWLYRIFAGVVAIGSIWIGLDLFSGEQCPTVNGLFLNVMVKACNIIGPKGALLMHALISVWVINKAFSKKTEEKLAKRHT